ncbi:MAG: hypothetical protein K0Q91_1843 [Fibrobacteria bacterium]|jgi:hypothetical protein|nr:hypothetical protein [Fibrobacteria bacterium]
MHPTKTFSSLFVAAFMVLSPAVAARAKTILVFPVSGEGAEARDLSAVTRLFKDALDGRSRGDEVTVAKTACEDRECALSRAKTAGVAADELVYSSFYKLGKKWIFSATILNGDGSNSFSQRLTAASIEDMEAVTQRMADALMQRKTADQAASVDNITEKEAEDDPARRRSLYRGGVAIGYFFPMGNSFEYVDSYDNFGNPEEIRGYRQMIRLTWLNTWEFRNNLQLGTDVVWNVPTSIGADASLRYLFGRGDYTPFVGGGLGLHYVRGDANNDIAEGGKRNSGPTLNAQGGMFLFRTYDVNVMLRGQYQVILNSDVDHGVAVDVGVSFGDKEGGKASSGSSGSGDGWSALEYVGAGVLTLIALSLITAAAN